MGHGWDGKFEQWANDCDEYYIWFVIIIVFLFSKVPSLSWWTQPAQLTCLTFCTIIPIGAWQGAKDFEFKVWHSNIEKFVYQESPWINKYVDTILSSNPNLQNGFMCAHVRRGNFKKACKLYDEEIQSGTSCELHIPRLSFFMITLCVWNDVCINTVGSPRPWVKQFYDRELVCYVNDKIFIDQVTAVMKLWYDATYHSC